MTDTIFPESAKSGRENLRHLPPRINLSTGEDIKREMGRVYRDARSQKIEPGDATKLVFILTAILRAHEVACIERRIEHLEEAESKCL